MDCRLSEYIFIPEGRDVIYCSFPLDPDAALGFPIYAPVKFK